MVLPAFHRQHSPPELIANTSLGAIQGTISANARAWLRVPYAEAPLGSRRWQPPVSKLPWQSTADATAFGPACAQPPGFDPPLTSTAEDCLTMAVYAPLANAALAPVLVYFHGGSFLNGGAAEARLNASLLVQRYHGEIVVAVVQYRLGVLGFLGADALRGRGGDKSTGNYGLQDQRESLRFLRQHAAAFGGDPSQITIAGQSAGAGCTSVHVVSRRSASLFDRAVLWSGAFSDWIAARMPLQEAVFSSIYQELCGSGAAPAAHSVEAAQGVGGAPPAFALGCLEQADVDALVEVAQRAADTLCGWHACLQATIDDVELTDHPRSLFANASSVLGGLPLLLGATLDEGEGFDAGAALAAAATPAQAQAWLGAEYALNSSMSASLYELYAPIAMPRPAAGASAAYVVAEWVETDQSMFCGARRAAARTASIGRAPAYLYRFARGVGGSPWSHHSDDIPFWFGALEAVAAAGGDGDDAALASAMATHLVKFTRTGAPAAAWVPFRLESPASLRFDAAAGGGARGLNVTIEVDANAAQCAFWDLHPYFDQESLRARKAEAIRQKGRTTRPLQLQRITRSTERAR